MLPATRRSDSHNCPAHGCGEVCALKAARVETNSLSQARGTDPVVCAGGTLDFIVTGSGTVTVGSQPAARMSDKTMHGGVITFGAGNVVIGGPTVGVVLGGSDAVKKACEAAAKGRRSGSKQQSYDNCGVEAVRIITNQANGTSHTEDEVLDDAMAHGRADRGATRRESGGMNMLQQEQHLKAHGVDASPKHLSEAELLQAIAERKGVITNHDAGKLWNSPADAKQAHFVIPYATEYGPDGKPKAIIVLDTGTGNCAERIPMDRFWNSLDRDPKAPDPIPAVVTRKPIW